MTSASKPTQWPISLGAALLIFAGLHLVTAADAPDGEMDFPRNVLTWYLSGEAEKLWPHAGEVLRELAYDVEGLREAAVDIREMMGPPTAMLDEQIFDHPEDKNWRIYIRTARHARVEEMFWVVIFSPSTGEVQVIMAHSRQTIQTLFPQARLP